MWNREEYWHGEALAAVLARHGITVGYDELKAARVKLEWRDKLAPLKQSVLGNIVGDDFVAVHMSWGAANCFCSLNLAMPRYFPAPASGR